MSYNSFARPGDVTAQPVAPLSGQRASHLPCLTGVNIGGAAQQTQALTNSLGTANEAFSITVTNAVGVTVATVSGTTGSSSSSAALCAGDIVDAFNTNPDAAGLFQISRASAVITFVTEQSGVSYTLASATSGISGNFATSVSAGSPAHIRPGRALMLSGQQLGGRAGVRMALEGVLTAQADAYVFSGVTTGDIVTLTIEMNGERVHVEELYATSQSATLTALVAAAETAVNAEFGADFGVAVTLDTATVSVTADVAGAEFNSSVYIKAESGGAGTGTVARTSNLGAATSLRGRFAGICAYDRSIMVATEDGRDGGYPAQETVPYAASDEIWAYVDGSPTQGGVLWIDTDATVPGQLSASPTAANEPILAPWLTVALVEDSAAGVCLVRVNRA